MKLWRNYFAAINVNLKGDYGDSCGCITYLEGSLKSLFFTIAHLGPFRIQVKYKITELPNTHSQIMEGIFI